MSEPEKADSEEAKRAQNLAKVAALMRYAPDLFDKQMADLANNPEAMRELAAVMPAKLTPGQQAEAMAKIQKAMAAETRLDLRAIIEHMRDNSSTSPGEALDEMLWASLKLLRGEDGQIDKSAHPVHAQLDALWQPDAQHEQEQRAEAKAFYRRPK